MSSIVGAITGGGGQGVNYKAQAPNLLNPATVDQANEQYKQAQDALQQQQAFVQQVQAQNGLGNQSSVFNQLQGVANGTGPNPAQAMLANSTGQNVANQASLMAGQRGSSANVGLMARQAGQQGGNLQQQAAGQGAALQAQQSLGALNQMGGIAGQQAGMQQSAVQGYTGATQNEQQQILQMIQAQNNAAVGAATTQNTSNAAIQGKVAEGQMNLIGNLAGGAGSAMMAKGGMVGYADGGDVSSQQVNGTMPMQSNNGPKSKIGQYLNSNQNWTGAQQDQDKLDPLSKGGQQLGAGLVNLGQQAASSIGDMFGSTPAPQAMAGGPMDNAGSAMPLKDMAMAAEGGQVPAMVSPGEGYLPPDKVKKVKKGADPLKEAEIIPGTPTYPGNDYRNDVVPKTLKSGGLVLPNEVMQSKNPHWAAHKFVMAHMKEQALKGKK